LIATTDPAPSLADAFKVPLSAAPRRIPLRTGSLHAVEINAAQALRKWIAQRYTSLETIARDGTWLDAEDVTNILSLSLPGIDEIAALLELARYSQSSRFDLVIVDTAPTGHTLRMLDMPETLFGVARVFDSMREKHRVMVAALRGSTRQEREDLLIEELAGDARTLAAMLRHSGSTRISWVSLAEPMAMAETTDALAALHARAMPVKDLIINRLTPVPTGGRGPRRVRCGCCDAKRSLEAATLRSIPVGAARTIHLYERSSEPRGIAALRRIGHELHGHGARQTPPGPSAPRAAQWTALVAGAPATVDSLSTESTRLLMFGGKGGVGKTTCAAAAAIAAAARWPARRVLLISTDPAHSLADALGTPLSDTAVRVPGRGHLTAREIDASKTFNAVKIKYAAAIDTLFDRLGSGGSLDAGHDRSVMHGLIDLAPPGLDELVATIEIIDAVSGDDPLFHLAVVDTAPTGHALRLLEMPALIHDWTHALMTILLKYQPVIGLGDLGSLLLRLSRGIGRFRTVLTDREATRFVVVTRAAALPRAESVRLVQRLDDLKIHTPSVVVNAFGRGTCASCRTAASRELREIDALRRAVLPRRAGRQLITAATTVPPPRGRTALGRWQRTAWRYRVPPRRGR
jgi:arsenite-transporting ATPase